VAKRIQRKRTKGWRMPDGVVYVGRPSTWGNPFALSIFGGDRQRAVDSYRDYMTRFPTLAEAARKELVGKDLACWCPLDKPCHADVLLELANSPLRASAK